MERLSDNSDWQLKLTNSDTDVPRHSSAANEPTSTSRRHKTRNRRRGKKTGRSSASDVDDVKCRRRLFVGQLPIDVCERQLRVLFAEFGRVVQLKISHDDDTGNSHGLVTYATAVSAQNARKSLHNVVQLPGTRRPLQVNFVDHLANYRRRKLFVGRISRHLTETDLVATFASFGHIDDCAIIRHPCTGLSAGCAFVTFADSASASAAINCLHRSQLAFGGSSSMVVRLADSRRT